MHYSQFLKDSEILTSGKINRIVLNKLLNINTQRENHVLFAEHIILYSIGDKHFNIFFYADDILLASTTITGLQLSSHDRCLHGLCRGTSME